MVLSLDPHCCHSCPDCCDGKVPDYVVLRMSGWVNNVVTTADSCTNVAFVCHDGASSSAKTRLPLSAFNGDFELDFVSSQVFSDHCVYTYEMSDGVEIGDFFVGNILCHSNDLGATCVVPMSQDVELGVQVWYRAMKMKLQVQVRQNITSPYTTSVSIYTIGDGSNSPIEVLTNSTSPWFCLNDGTIVDVPTSSVDHIYNLYNATLHPTPSQMSYSNGTHATFKVFASTGRFKP